MADTKTKPASPPLAMPPSRKPDYFANIAAIRQTASPPQAASAGEQFDRDEILAIIRHTEWQYDASKGLFAINGNPVWYFTGTFLMDTTPKGIAVLKVLFELSDYITQLRIVGMFDYIGQQDMVIELCQHHPDWHSYPMRYANTEITLNNGKQTRTAVRSL